MTETRAEALQRAAAMIEVHRPEEAMAVLRLLLAQEPDVVRAWCLLSQAQLQAKRSADALDSAGHALALAPDSEWAHRLASVAHSGLDQTGPALAHARESVRLSPQSWQTHARLAMAASQDNPTRAEAGQAGAAAVSLAPNEAEAHFTLGFAAGRSGDQVLAEQAYRRCLQIRPDHSAAQNNLGVIQLNQGRLLDSATEFASAAVSDPRMEQSRRNIDVAARRLARRFHWIVLAVWLLVIALLARAGNGTAALSGSPTGSDTTDDIIAVLGITLIGLLAACWRMHQRLPPALRSYLRTLPGRDHTLAAWLALDLAALGTLGAVPFVGEGLRAGLTTVAIVCLAAGALSAIWGSRRRRRATT